MNNVSGVFLKFVKPYNKELSDVIASELEPETKAFTIGLFIKPLTKSLTGRLNKDVKSDKVRNGLDAVIQTMGGVYGFSVTTCADICKCPRYYGDFKGLFSYNPITDDLVLIDDSDIVKSVWHGTGRMDATSACAVEVDISKGCAVSVQELEDYISGRLWVRHPNNT